MIYIYNGPGASAIGIQWLAHSLSAYICSENSIKYISYKEVQDGTWQEDAQLFILPGGADLPYVSKLNGAGNAAIRKYVENGGSFLGICAGAYYCSRNVNFDVDGKLEVIGARELNFYLDDSTGPLKKYCYETNIGAEAMKITLLNQKSGEGMLKVYYNGGGYFNNAKTYEEITILAEYAGCTEAAIIERNIGKGKVILSGVHFEVAYDLLDLDDEFLGHISKELKEYEKRRINLLRGILIKLGIALTVS